MIIIPIGSDTECSSRKTHFYYFIKGENDKTGRIVDETGNVVGSDVVKVSRRSFVKFSTLLTHEGYWHNRTKELDWTEDTIVFINSTGHSFVTCVPYKNVRLQKGMYKDPEYIDIDSIKSTKEAFNQYAEMKTSENKKCIEMIKREAIEGDYSEAKQEIAERKEKLKQLLGSIERDIEHIQFAAEKEQEVIGFIEADTKKAAALEALEALGDVKSYFTTQVQKLNDSIASVKAGIYTDLFQISNEEEKTVQDQKVEELKKQLYDEITVIIQNFAEGVKKGKAFLDSCDDDDPKI